MEQVQEGSDLKTYGYTIDPRPAALGGGWRLRLLENGEEIGGGVFPPLDIDDARLALDMAYSEALEVATDWLETRK